MPSDAPFLIIPDQRSAHALTYRAWYKTARWLALRKHQLSKQPLCERCLARNVITPATVAHHAQPHKGNAALFFDPDNLRSSCSPCHDIDEQRIERGGKPRQDVGEDGWPI